MSLIETTLRLIAGRLGVERPALDSFFSSNRLGRPTGAVLPLPLELIPIGARLWARGWLNDHALDLLTGWVLPYWATRQNDPTGRGFVSRALYPVTLNQNQRDWTMVGNPARPREALVDPRGLVTPWYDGWSLDGWLCVDGQVFFPSRLTDEQVQQHLLEGLPIVVTRYDAARLRVRSETFAIQAEEGSEWVVSTFTIENPRPEPRHAAFCLSLRPFNPEGVSLVRRVEYRAAEGETAVASGLLAVNGDFAVVLPVPSRVGCSDLKRGDVAGQLPNLDGSVEANCDAGLATAVVQYELDLDPNSSRTIVALMPLEPTAGIEDRTNEIIVPAALSADTTRQLRERAASDWRARLDRGMRVTLPDDKINAAFEANKTHLLLLHDGASITPGPYLYHRFWIRDAAYMLNALDKLGYHAETAEVLKTFRRQVQKDGFFHSQEREWDANGQALWTLVEHARLSGDWEIIHDEYWSILNMAHWIDAARQRTKTADHPPHWGLLPAGFSAEHLGPPNYYYWDDFWGMAGLREAARAAGFFALSLDAARLREQFEAFRGDVDRSLARVAERLHTPLVPAAPDRAPDAAMIASLAALYPTRVFEPSDPRIVATMRALKEIAWLEDAFFHHVGHTSFGTYLSLHMAECLLFQRDPAAWPIIEWVLRHASPTFGWAEGIHPVTRHGGMGDGLHGWASADWIHVIRNAMLFEEGDTLVLTPALPAEWTAETTVMRVDRASTYFGEVNYTIAFGLHAATLVLKASWRQRPTSIEWNLPFRVLDAGSQAGGPEVVDKAVRIPVPEGASTLRVVARW